MLDSIYVGLTGLLGYTKSLKVISNNVANLNTPGFKSSSLQFADLFYSTQQAGTGTPGGTPGDGAAQFGTGLSTLATSFNFQEGQVQQTGNDLDAAISGNGLFVLKDAQGNILYTRAGQFGLDNNGILVNNADSAHVQALTADGQLVDISVAGLRSNPPQATKTVTFNGNLSSTQQTDTVDSVKVIDSLGGTHLLKLVFTSNAASTTPGTTATPGQWTVQVTDDSNNNATVGGGTIQFNNGQPDPTANSFTVNLTPTNGTASTIKFDFSTSVTSFDSGTQSTLAFNSADGFAEGALSKTTFDADGNLVLTYSNGQTVQPQRLALAEFDRPDAQLQEMGGNEFAAQGDQPVHYGFAGTDVFGKITPGSVEISNVDLSQEFSNLIVSQRGYQASSQVISTANDLLQTLLAIQTAAK